MNLKYYISNSQSELLIIVKNLKNELFDLIFVLLTSENTGDDTENFIFMHPTSINPYIFMLNKYILIFSFINNEAKNKYEIWNNSGNEPIKIGFLTLVEWKGIKESFIIEYSKTATEILKRDGKVPYQGRI